MLSRSYQVKVGLDGFFFLVSQSRKAKWIDPTMSHDIMIFGLWGYLLFSFLQSDLSSPEVFQI